MRRKRALHLCVMNRNLGDNALNLAIRRMVKPLFKVSHMKLISNDFGPEAMEKLTKVEVIIFGGGGLIHSYGPHGNPWQRTGTMWHIELDNLRAIQGKIVLYGVGFNHFHNERGPTDQMGDFFRILLEKQAIVAFRNDGSKERFLSFFPEFYHAKIEEIPDPGGFYRPPPARSKRPYVLLQIAADRLPLRYGDRFDEFLAFIDEICKEIQEDIYLIPHTVDDERLYRSLELSFPVKVLPLRRHWLWTRRMIGLYGGAEFTISTRGHSQICSVGNGVPTFSISTHPKVWGFAESAGLSGWCYRFHEEAVDSGQRKFWAFFENIAFIRAHLKKINQKFDEQNHCFLQTLRGIG